jgi:hypothetical protein
VPVLPPTRFAHPGGQPLDVIAALDTIALGAARARVAARLGDPDPFGFRTALASAAPGLVPAAEGTALTPDAADAVLLGAALALDRPDPAFAGLFAGRPPGPRARAVPIDDARFTFLRFQRGEPPPAPAWGPVESWSVGEIGDEPIATVRCIVALPDGVALGSDYGLVLWRRGRFEAFPWPAGCRREARRVEAMVLHGSVLVVATSQATVRWDFRATPTFQKHPQDDEGGWDEVRCLHTDGPSLLAGFRTGLVGGAHVGLREVFALADLPGGVVVAGTVAGELHVLGADAPPRTLATGRHQPVRHLAFADGVLHAAAGNRHHRWDGAAWTSCAPEPTAFAVDRRGRLWMLAEGRLFAWTRGGPIAIPVPLDRPWSLCAAGDRLWIGGRERVWALPIR